MAPELFAHDESPSLDLVDRTDCWWVLRLGRDTPWLVGMRLCAT